MQHAAEDAHFLAAGESARQFTISSTTLRRVARRAAIIPVMHTSSGIGVARLAHADVTADAARPRGGIRAVSAEGGY